jgi:hypothetical protein
MRLADQAYLRMRIWQIARQSFELLAGMPDLYTEFATAALGPPRQEPDFQLEGRARRDSSIQHLLGDVFSSLETPLASRHCWTREMRVSVALYRSGPKRLKC